MILDGPTSPVHVRYQDPRPRRVHDALLTKGGFVVVHYHAPSRSVVGNDLLKFQRCRSGTWPQAPLHLH